MLDDALYVFLLYAVPLLNILFRSKEVLCTNTLYIGFGVNHPSGRMLMTNENGNDNGGGTTVAGGTSVSGNNNGSGSEHNGSGSDHDAIDFFKKTPSVVGVSMLLFCHVDFTIKKEGLKSTRRNCKINFSINFV